MELANIIPYLAKWTVYLVGPLLVIRVIHRLWFHPLHKYPGPLLGRLTSLYSGFWASKESLHLETYRNIQRYGPIVRVSPNRLIFNTISAIPDIYSNPAANKGQAYLDAMVRSKHPSIIVAVDKAKHRQKRKLISPAFSERTIREIEPSMRGHINTFLRLILTTADDGKPADLSPLTKRLGIDIIGQLAFGYEFKTQTDATHRNIYSVVEFMAWRLNIYMQCRALRFLEGFLILSHISQLGTFAKVLKTVIHTRMADTTNAKHDLYSIIMENLSVEERTDDFYSGELWPESVVLFSAGGLSVSAVLSATFFYLSRHPRCYEALVSEIHSNFNSDAEIIMGPKLQSCKYLRACLDEAMRMSSPGLSVSWRELDKDAPGPFIVDGHVIPRGTSVGISPYALFHSEEYFPNPFTYNPDRFLEQSGETDAAKEARNTARKAFIPFSVGDRNCAGKVMAYAEMSLVLARTLWYFDFKMVPGKEGESGAGGAGKWKGKRGRRAEEYQLGDIIVTTHEGPNLMFTKRREFEFDSTGHDL